MKTKKLRIVSLLIAAIMMMSLSGMAFAYEDEDIVVNPIEMPALPPACGEECADHSHDSDGFVGIEPANILCTFGHSWSGWNWGINQNTMRWQIVGTAAICMRHVVDALYWRECTRCNRVETRPDSIVVLATVNQHNWDTPLSNGLVRCRDCGYITLV